jgi:hypothetical protein
MGEDLRLARDTVGYFRLWFGFFGGAAAWTVMHLVSYLWATIYCGSIAEILLHATTVSTTLVTLAACWVCYRNWKRLQNINPSSPGVFRFLLISGLYLNLIFLITILATGTAVFFLTTCPA